MPQSLSQLYVHLIFSTKHREPMLLSPVREDLHAYLAAVLNNQDSPALKVGGMSDHVHALFRLSKNIALAKIVEEGRVVSDCAAAHPELGTIRADSLVNTGPQGVISREPKSGREGHIGGSAAQVDL